MPFKFIYKIFISTCIKCVCMYKYMCGISSGEGERSRVPSSIFLHCIVEAGSLIEYGAHDSATLVNPRS